MLNYTFVGVKVTNVEELEAAYAEFVRLGYSESHSQSVERMAEFLEHCTSFGEVFGLCIDKERDILGVYEFDIDKLMSPIARCTVAELETICPVIFPL